MNWILLEELQLYGVVSSVHATKYLKYIGNVLYSNFMRDVQLAKFNCTLQVVDQLWIERTNELLENASVSPSIQ